MALDLDALRGEDGRGRGFGAIQSPPDGRDYQITTLLEADGLIDENGEYLAGLAYRYIIPNLPPILDQGWTPTCVAHGASTMKAWHDHIDQGQFFNFAEMVFFQQIGGTMQGAVARYALDRLRTHGYPVMSVGQEYLHKIDAYYAVSKSIGVIKQAVASYGPVLMLGPWYESWSNPPSSAVLPYPTGMANGHLTVIEGWDDARWAFYCQNSWGTNWGSGGRFWMPYSYAVNIMWEFWKAIDQKVHPAPLPDTAIGDPDVAIIGSIRIVTPRLYDVKAGVQLRKGPGTSYAPHHLTTRLERYKVHGFHEPSGWVFSSNPANNMGFFFVPPDH